MSVRKALVLAIVVTVVAFTAWAQAEDASCTKNYADSGLTSIFCDQFSFFHEGEKDLLSIPPARCGCRVKLLNTGEQSFAWRLRLLREAGQSIRIQTYIFTADDIGKKAADRLKKARRKGVEVKLIVDAYTKFRPNDRRLYADLELKGVTVMGLEPAYLLGVVNNRILDVDDVNKRFHEKYWVIDDQVALLGGTNIANEYARYGDDPRSKWRDQDVMIQGDLVADVARAFDQNYEYFRERRLARLRINQPNLWSELWWKISGATPVDTDPGEPLSREAKRFDDENATVRFIRQRPRHNEDYIYQAYLHLIRNAEKSILIENAYFVPNRPLQNSLLEAAARGVVVTVITNSDQTNDVTGMQPLSRYSYLPLIEGGVAIHEWQGDHPGFGSLHAKCAVFDGRVSVIGSMNFDPRSIYLNSENAVIIDSQPVAQAQADYITQVDLKNSLKISRDQAKEWRKPEGAGDQFRLLFGMALEDWY